VLKFHKLRKANCSTKYIIHCPVLSAKSMPREGDFLADLAVISYEKLLKKDPAESSKLLTACVEWGFFYLDLSSLTAENYRNLVSAMNSISQEYFSRPLEEKMKDTKEEWGVFNICG
jgi:hypothetical protein